MNVSALGLGGAEIGFRRTSDEIVDTLVGTARDCGINVIDTAAMYADSEEKLGRALRNRRKDFYVFTKCGRFAPPVRSATGFVLRALGRACRSLGRPHRAEGIDWHPRALRWTIEQSLRRLQTDYLDVIQLHSCSEAVLRQGDVVEVLQRARDAGKARHIGYSGDAAAGAYALRCGLFQSVQMSINLADQQPCEAAVGLAARHGLGVIAKRPIANGLWRPARRPDDRDHQAYWHRFRQLRYEFLRGERAFEMALRFTQTVPGVDTAIVGTTDPEHLLQNVRYTENGPLDADDFAAIRARWQQVARPDWVGQT